MTQKASQRFRKNIEEFDEELELFPALKDDEEPITMGDMAATVAQYVLASVSGKPALKEQDVRRMCKVDDITWITIYNQVNKQLESSIGFKMVRGDDDFLFISNVLQGSQNCNDSDIQSDARRGFLHIILAFILMDRHPCVSSSFGKVSSEKIWAFLQSLDIQAKFPDKYLGDVGQLFSSFVKEGWLSLVPEVDGRPVGDDIHYKWGPLALSSVSPMEMLQSFCEINGNDNAAVMWKSHYAHIRKMEKAFRERLAGDHEKDPFQVALEDETDRKPPKVTVDED